MHNLSRWSAAVFFVLLLPLVAQESADDLKSWKHSGSLWILTTPEGADLPATAVVEQFPLLVRLHKDFFDFSQAKPKGEDLRFASPDGKRLPHQIEHWDATAGEADIWVRIPKITGNARQEVKLHWGRADAADTSDGKAVFNESNGYVSVWHMNETVRDEVGTLPSEDKGTSTATGVIGAARHFPGGKGVFCGDKIETLPSGAGSHSTEAWFRTSKPNTTIIGWGNEGGGRGSKVRMLFRSPPHIKIDSDFSDVRSDSRLPLGEWIHVVHTYDEKDGRIYINGVPDGSSNPLLNIKSPGRLWLGGWYHNYDFVGQLDEVRVSRVARSADWVKLQYENQKPRQRVVGPVVRPGTAFSVSSDVVKVDEGKTATVTAEAGGAQKVYWLLKRGDQSSIVATDRFSYTFDAGRVVGDQTRTLTFQAVYADQVKSRDIAVTIREAIPEPIFTLKGPAEWDGRQRLEITPEIANRSELEAKGAGKLNLTWTADDVAILKEVAPDRLILKRAQGDGQLRISAAIDNGGQRVVRSLTIAVQQPPPKADAWVPRPLAETEQPEDGQFIPREGRHSGIDEGTLVYAGKLTEPADSVFVRLFADDKLFATETAKVTAEKTYSLKVKLKAGLVKYRTEFGAKTGDRETVLHSAKDLVCGDVYLIQGQSNAVATDFGKVDPPPPSEWLRTFGATDGSPNGSRLKLWAPAQARSPGGKSEIGYWGMELGRRLVEREKIPICILNGAVGGTRIDQHQRNDTDPTDAATIYGRLLWRAQQAKLTHGVRAVFWHQGENDQGADGPTGGFGFETYRQYFVDLAAAWREDFPNIQRYYVFQIWPKSCSMGINGSDNQLREVQRTLPKLFSNLSVMSTLGVKPPGGCHFPAAGYAEFARLIHPLMEYQLYHRFTDGPILAPNLKRAYFASDARDEVVLEFDQQVVWADALASQFHFAGKPQQVASGSVNGTQLILKLKAPTKSEVVTYLDSANWNPDNLLYGRNGIAALTFCDVPIEPRP